MTADRTLQVIMIPEAQYDEYVCDMSSREAMAEYESLDDYCEHHGVRRQALERHALAYREVVLDMRVVRYDEESRVTVVEFKKEEVEALRVICCNAYDNLHFDGLGILEAERACRRALLGMLK